MASTSTDTEPAFPSTAKCWRKAAKDIAAGEGDLGALLFAGMAGLPGVQDALSRTQNTANAFHRLEGRRTKSSALGAGLNALKESNAVLKARLTPQVQSRLDADVIEAETREAEARDALAHARRAEACERDAEILREKDDILTKLNTTLSDLPPCSWSPEEAEAARGAVKELQAASKRHANARQELEKTTEQAALHPRDGTEGIAATVLAALEELHVEDVPVLSRLGPVNDDDLARIRKRRGELAILITEQRARFGLQTPAYGLADAVEPGLRAAADAGAALDRARTVVDRARMTLDALPAVATDHDIGGLRDTLDALRVARYLSPAPRSGREGGGAGAVWW